MNIILNKQQGMELLQSLASEYLVQELNKTISEITSLEGLTALVNEISMKLNKKDSNGELITYNLI